VKILALVVVVVPVPVTKERCVHYKWTSIVYGLFAWIACKIDWTAAKLVLRVIRYGCADWRTDGRTDAINTETSLKYDEHRSQALHRLPAAAAAAALTTTGE